MILFCDPDLFVQQDADHQCDRIDDKSGEVAGEFKCPGELIHPYFDDCLNEGDADEDDKDRIDDLEPCLFCFRKKIAKDETDKGLSDRPGDAEGSAFEQFRNDAAQYADDRAEDTERVEIDAENDISQVQFDAVDDRDDDESGQYDI